MRRRGERSCRVGAVVAVAVLLVGAFGVVAACGGAVEPERTATTTASAPPPAPPPPPSPMPTATAPALDGSCTAPSDCPSDRPVCCLRPSNTPDAPWPATCVESCIMNSETFEACATDADCKEMHDPCTTHVCGGRTYRFCQTITQRCEK